MQPLTQEFIRSCRREKGFIIRGENMTRIETFVDAAFAFALTMLIISVDEIPDSPKALLIASRDIPAFLASGLQIGLIWFNHSVWSRRFGLQDAPTVMLSLALVMLVLVFIYPLKLVFMGLFAWISGGYLSPSLEGMDLNSLSDLFVYFATGLVCLAVILYLFYYNTLKNADALRLTAYERYFCHTELKTQIILAVTAVVSGIMAKTLPGLWVTTAGFVYASLFFSNTIWYKYREKRQPTIDE